MASILYSDLDMDLNGPLVYNKGAIEQAIMNLFSTGKTERSFQPDLYGSVEEFLFGIIDDFTAYGLRHRIIESIERWDNRVSVDNALSSVTADPDNSRFFVELVLSINGMNDEKSSVSLYFNKA